jgi:tetratricopeptide (TPR) repeat protein
MTASKDNIRTMTDRLKKDAENEPGAMGPRAADIFFQALAEGDEATLEITPEALRRASPGSRIAQAWAAYLETILATEQYRWDVAEQRALEALQWSDDEGLRGRILNELGILSDQLGRWEEAIHYYRGALALFEAVNDRVYVAKAAKNLGTALVRGVEGGELPKQALVEAETLELQALDIFEEMQIEGLCAATCNELGAVLKAMERWEEARACYERFLAFCQRIQDDWGQGQALNNIAEVLLLENQPERAVTLWMKALPRVEGHVWDEIDVQMHLAQAYKRMGDLAAAERWSQVAIDSVESVRTRLQVAQTRIDFFALQQRPYQIASDLALAQGDAAQVLSLAERARARTFADLLATRQVSGIGNLEVVQPMTAGRIQEQLPDDGALLMYFETDVELLAILVRKEKIDIKPLGVTLDQIAAASFDRHGRPRGLIQENGRLGRPWLLSKLGTLLLQPLGDALLDVQRLWLAPHGLLHHLPLLAMPAMPDGRLLGDIVPQTAQTPSATILLRYLQKRPPLENGGLFLGHDGQRLRYAELESVILAEQWGSRALVGEEATLAALRTSVVRDGVLHLACPGVFRPDQPLRSGVALADDFLDVAGVFSLFPLSVGLVTLSACETGRGHIQRGDEIAGLVRAWLYAGSAAVLVSLWQVDDLSSLLLMRLFYQRLPETGAAVALQRAQQALRTLSQADSEALWRDLAISPAQQQTEMERLARMWNGALPEHPYDHPYFWAAFVLHSGLN